MPIPPGYRCPACGSDAFVHVPNASFELWVGMRGRGHTDDADPLGELLVCERCGKAELFVADPAAFAASQRQPAGPEGTAAEPAEALPLAGFRRSRRRRSPSR